MKTPFPALLIEVTKGAMPTCRILPCTVLELKEVFQQARITIPVPGSLYAVEKWASFDDLASTRPLAVAKVSEAIASVIETLPVPDEKSAKPATAGAGTGANP